MASQTFELSPEVHDFIAREVKCGAYKDANEVIAAAVRLLEQENEDESWKIFALEQALAEGEASGIVEGDVFEQIRAERKLPRTENVALG